MVVHGMETEKTARARSDPSPGEQNQQQQFSATAIPSRSECACSGDGWIVRDGKAFRCPCSIDRRLAAHFTAAYRAARLTNFRCSIRNFMYSWLSRPTAGLFIFGPVGTGKTFLAAALLRALLEADWHGRQIRQTDIAFCRAAQYIADLQESYRTNTSTDAIVENLVRPKFLIVDDIGSGALSDHERRFTLELIERRIHRNRPTILTSNWSREEIGDKMDARISSRLALFTELKLAGDDLRELHGDVPIDHFGISGVRGDAAN